MTTSIGIAADQAAFLAAIRAAPDDDTRRVAYADWLQEHDDPCSLCPKCKGETEVIPRSAPNHIHIKCDRCNGVGHVPNNFAERAEFIRVKCKIDSAPLLEHNKDMGFREWEGLAKCAGELRPEWPFVFCSGRWWRGFVQDITDISWADWLAHHAQILSHPDVVLRRVELTTWPEQGWLTDHAPAIPGMTRIVTRDAEVPDILRSVFPGHCEYEVDGQIRHHPIQWVLPGDTSEYPEANFEPLFG